MSSSIQAKGWVCPKCKKEKPAIAAKCTCGAWKPGYTPNAAAKKPGQLLKWKCPKCKHEKPATALRCMPCNTYQPGHAPAKPKRLCPDCQKTDLNIGLCSCWVKKETTRRKEMLQSIPPVHVIARIVYDGFRGQIPFNTKHHPIVIPPEQVTIGQLKDIILREVFGRQTRIAPPPKGLMSLFYHDKELMPPTSLLAEDHGFRGTRDGSVAMPKSLNTLGIDTGFISRKFGFDITLYVDQVLTFEVVPSPFQDTAQRGGLSDVTCGGLLAPNNTFSLHFPNKKSLMKEVTAAQAKEQLQLVSGIPIERLHILSASGGESDVQKQDFQVSPSSIRTCADEWLVHVLTLNGKHWKVGIDSTSTLRLLKERIRWSGCRVDDDGHLILGDGKVLPNDREEETIESLCLSDGCVLYVVEEIAAYFQETEERQQPTIPPLCESLVGGERLEFRCMPRTACLRQEPERCNGLLGLRIRAVNQHDVGGEIDGDDPKSSPFYKAMHLTKGTVTVLDRGSVTYIRIWCSYEISVVMTDLKSKSPGYLYDIYAMSKQDGTDVVHCPVGLTEGFAAADIYPKNQDGTLDTAKRDFEAKWTLSKSRREAAFPLDSASGALVVQLETASASVEDDKKRILNAIAGNTDNFLSDPPASHESYDKLNVRVRVRFALSSYRTALERHADMKPFRKRSLTIQKLIW
ncbi:expressed unknown protein [Seminavis robusta]|uniref:Ubiquitin-like domain-containing protein n=1 Tax=Seminavis robusta TaxID=568900 RepID=A0A9N8DG92_9STRA|nr:expressed unknown protein [Seminavis robusta]|eukprot:Sro130_g061830.1 n/a (687) ;mRNA; r:27380-29919